jgi:RND family efflux transporter MFP subunit
VARDRAPGARGNGEEEGMTHGAWRARGASRIVTVAATVALTLAVAGGAAWKLGWVRPPGDGTTAPGGGAAGGGAAGGRKLLFYRNPMNPAITSPIPAKDEMGMDYLPVYADAGGAPEKPKTIAEETADFFADDSAKVEGLAGVTLSEKGIALAGVRTVAATRDTARRVVRAVGRVVPDETAVRHVHAKVAGYVERLHASFTGQRVAKGDPLLDLYAPDILASEEEFLGALASARRLAAGDAAERESAAALVDAARRRLALYDVPEAVIAAIEREGRARRAVTLTAPVAGYVTNKGIVEGQQIEPGMELYTITDLARVWVEADLYEQEAGAARIGREATLTLPDDPSQRLTGKVTYVQPVLDPESRTIRVRFEFANPDLALKPGMFADVAITLDASTGVSVPETAIIDSGTRQVVFVALGNGRFEPRLVHLGVRGDGRAEVVSGVADGEQVVVGANFLLDSESRLRALVEQATAAAK